MKKNTTILKNVIPVIPEKAEIREVLSDLKKRLNLVYNLSPYQRKHIASLGESRIGFVKEIINVVKENPGIINGTYDICHLQQQLNASLYFLELSCAMEKIMMQLSDYSQLHGADVYKAALLIRTQINISSKLNPEYQALAERLNNYFPVPKGKRVKKNQKSKILKQSKCIEFKSAANM